VRAKNVNQTNEFSLVRIEIITDGECPKSFFDWNNDKRAHEMLLNPTVTN